MFLTRRILRAARRLGYQRLIFMYGSVAEYGERVWSLSPLQAEALEDYLIDQE